MSIPDDAIFELTLRGEAEALAPLLAHLEAYYAIIRRRGPCPVEPGSSRQLWHLVATANPATPPPRARKPKP